jgi:hypothetical protein
MATVLLRCAFLNCWNLFPLGAKVRATSQARTPPQLDKKIKDLASTLKNVFPGLVPDVIGLCEIADISLGIQVGDRIDARRYKAISSGLAPADNTGLVLLYDPAVLTPTLSPIEVGPRASMAGAPIVSSSDRARWMAVEFQLNIGSRAPFWCVTSHWKSNFRRGEQAAQSDRMQSAREIGELFQTVRTSTENMLLMGDLNCEPGDWPLKSQEHLSRPNQMRAFRQHRRVTREYKKLAYFYNPMWRWLGEPDTFEVAGLPGYTPPRVMGTHGPALNGGAEWLMYDQLLVTKRLLRGGQLTLQEASVRIVRPVDGCSDHCAIGAEFDCH